MNSLRTAATLLLTAILAVTLACSNSTKSPDVSENIRHALDQEGLGSISVSQDRDKNVVTLKGNVGSDDEKQRADTIAKANAGSAVVADEIGVRPSGDESTAKKVESKLDSGIDKNLEAKLIQHRLNHDVSYDVNNGVVTLKGSVPSEQQRSAAEKMAKQVPNVKQVVDELEVKGQKATTQ